ncbi:MAG: DegT/DnrJ/EryC1/StrS aminotransferase family protein [Actinomycetota bacterium]|jgi:perosamine synthetase|nr:DegT/DnrJ/EryC1/StrS aminotransferase family protein [Actinomycetota bacterium]
MSTDPDIHVAAPTISDEARRLVAQVLDSGRLAQGPMVERFEAQCAEMAGVAHGIAVSSGTDALEVAVDALDLADDDVVLTSPFTFAATANAVLRAGARVRFVDIDDDHLIDLDELAGAIADTASVGAVIPVHLFGLAPDMFRLSEVVGTVPIIEDAAQAHGATVGERSVGSFGAGCFSFYATKNVMSGEGGVITTADDSWADTMRTIRNQGMAGRYEYVRVGRNCRMTELQAAIAIPQMDALDVISASRRDNALRAVKGLADIEGLVLPREPAGRSHVWHQCTVLVPEGADRDAVVAEMQSNGVHPGVYYPQILNDIPVYRDHPRVEVGETPRARDAAARCVSLPIHQALAGSDMDRVVEAFAAAVSKQRR